MRPIKLRKAFALCSLLLLCTLLFEGRFARADIRLIAPGISVAEAYFSGSDAPMTLQIAKSDPLIMGKYLLYMIRQNKISDLRQQINQRIKTDNNPYVYMLDGMLHDYEGKHFLAQASYFRGLQLNPNNLSIRNFLAISYYLGGREDGAIKTLERLQRLDASGVQESKTLAMIYALSNNDAAATEMLDSLYGGSRTGELLLKYKELRQIPNSGHKTIAIFNLQLQKT